MDGPLQDLDRATAMIDIAMAVGGGRNSEVKALRDELLALIEPAREARRARAEAEAAAAENDKRNWYVAFFYITGQPEPPRLENLSTDELRELIRSGKVRGVDHVFQSWKEEDPETRELVEGDNLWDREWVDVKDVPIFAEDLAAAAGGGAAGGDAPAPGDAGGGAPSGSGGGDAPDADDGTAPAAGSSP